MAAPTLRNASTTGDATNTTGSSIVLNKPSGVQVGDVMFAHVAVRGTEAVSAPAGWNLVDTDTKSNLRGGLWYRYVDGSEGASFTFSWTTAFRRCGGVTAYSGVDQTNPIDDAGAAKAMTSSATASTSIPCGTVTTVTADCLLLSFVARQNSGTVTPPTGFSETDGWDIATNNGTAGANAASEHATKAASVAGSQAAGNCTPSATSLYVAHLVALKPAAAVSGSGSGSVDPTGSGSGTVPVAGSGSGSVAPAGSGSAVTAASGSGTGTVAPTGSGAGVTPVSGSGSGSVDPTGAGAAAASAAGTGAGSVSPAGSGSGAVVVAGSGSGAAVPIGSGSGVTAAPARAPATGTLAAGPKAIGAPAASARAAGTLTAAAKAGGTLRRGIP